MAVRTVPHIPPEPADGYEVILHIKASFGGEDAALFASELLEMYRSFAQRHGWGVEVREKPGISPGLYEAVLNVRGRDTYKYLRYESGVNRVQRVPTGELQGRVHTSSAIVQVLPLAVGGVPGAEAALESRNEKIRTFNFPDDRVTDHRIKFSVSGVALVLSGYVDPIIEALLKNE